MQRVDKTRWERKGIAVVRYQAHHPQRERSFNLDDFAYQRKPTDDILDHLETYMAPPPEMGVQGEEITSETNGDELPDRAEEGHELRPCRQGGQGDAVVGRGRRPAELPDRFGPRQALHPDQSLRALRRRNCAQQPFGVGMGRRGEHIGRVARLDDLAGVQHRHAMGQFAEAFANYKKVLALRQRLLAHAPQDRERQHALAIAYERMGEIQRAYGDFPQALVAFQDSITYGVERVGGLNAQTAMTAMFGGEGLSLATLEGDGQVLLQSMTYDGIANALRRHGGVND